MTYMLSVFCGCSNPQKRLVKSMQKKENIVNNAYEPQEDTLVSVIEAKEYTIFYPRYRNIDLVCDSMPTPVNR